MIGRIDAHEAIEYGGRKPPQDREEAVIARRGRQAVDESPRHVGVSGAHRPDQDFADTGDEWDGRACGSGARHGRRLRELMAGPRGTHGAPLALDRRRWTSSLPPRRSSRDGGSGRAPGSSGRSPGGRVPRHSVETGCHAAEHPRGSQHGTGATVKAMRPRPADAGKGVRSRRCARAKRPRCMILAQGHGATPDDMISQSAGQPPFQSQMRPGRAMRSCARIDAAVGYGSAGRQSPCAAAAGHCVEHMCTNRVTDIPKRAPCGQIGDPEASQPAYLLSAHDLPFGRRPMASFVAHW